jgi:hypothetical protein
VRDAVDVDGDDTEPPRRDELDPPAESPRRVLDPPQNPIDYVGQQVINMWPKEPGTERPIKATKEEAQFITSIFGPLTAIFRTPQSPAAQTPPPAQPNPSANASDRTHALMCHGTLQVKKVITPALEVLDPAQLTMDFTTGKLRPRAECKERFEDLRRRFESAYEASSNNPAADRTASSRICGARSRRTK